MGQPVKDWVQYKDFMQFSYIAQKWHFYTICINPESHTKGTAMM